MNVDPLPPRGRRGIAQGSCWYKSGEGEDQWIRWRADVETPSCGNDARVGLWLSV